MEGDRNACSSSNGNRAAAFGVKMPAVLMDISKSRFRGRVLGPVGMLVKLKDSSSGGGSGPVKGIEKSIGAMMNSFVVGNAEDRNELSRILKRHGVDREHRIILQEPRPRYNVNVQQNSVAELTVIEDDDVFNALVDQCRIDSVVIARDEEECDRLYVEKRNGRDAFIGSVASVITWAGTTVMYRSGNRNTEMMWDNQYKRRLASDFSQFIEDLNSQIQTERMHESTIAEKLNHVSMECRKGHEQNKQLENQIRKVQSEIGSLNRQKQELESQLTVIKEAEEADTTTHEAEEHELIEAIATVNCQEKEKKIVVEECKRTQSSYLQQKRNAEGRKETLKSQLREATAQMEKFLSQQQQQKREEEQLTRQRSNIEAECKSKESIITQMELDLEGTMQIAHQKCSELVEDWSGEMPAQTREDKPALERKLARLRSQLESQRVQAGLAGRTKETVTSELQKCITEFEAFCRDYMFVERSIAELKSDLDKRTSKWNKLLMANSKMVTRNFDGYLQHKGRCGKVEFNHEDKTLKLVTLTDNSDENTLCNDVRQLSGGERSFTTLCLLLALGHVVRL